MIIDTWNTKILDIANACRMFIEESNYPLVYNEYNTIDSLWYSFESFNSAIIVDYTDNELNGFAIVSRDNEYHDEYFGYIGKFYVLPHKRRGRAAFRLLDEITEWFDYRHCVMSFATATAGIGKDDVFIKLLSRYGYVQQPNGVLVRKQKEHE